MRSCNLLARMAGCLGGDEDGALIVGDDFWGTTDVGGYDDRIA